MAINLNNSVPAAPTGGTNVLWQEDTSGNVSAYVSAPGIIAASSKDLTAQQANIAGTNLITSPTAGCYRISVYIAVTTKGGSSSTLPATVFTWNDQQSGQAMSLTLTPTNAGNALTTFQDAVGFISANTSAIQYSTTGYVSAGSPQMQYALHIRIEQM